MLSLTVRDWLIAPTVVLCYYLYRWWSRKTLDKVRGPKSASFLYGNLPELLHAQAGETEFKWYAEYGPVVKFNGVLSDQRLLIADPKALHHIFQANGYGYSRDYMRRMFGKAFGGNALASGEGKDHRRQRRTMQPSFGASETRALLPFFLSSAAKMTSKWTELLSNEGTSDTGMVLDLPSWVSRATLDAIGLAAFDYDFGALDNANNELSRVYRNLFKDLFSKPSKGTILAMGLLEYLPERLITALLRRNKSPRMLRRKQLSELSRSVSIRLIEGRALDGSERKDLLSQILKANTSENPKSRLDDREMHSLLGVILLAGHETTANTLSWTTMELSKHPEVQTRLRREIQAMERKIRERGDAEFTAQDFEAMPYLTAVVKEVLRVHPAAAFIQRMPSSDDVLPLSKPLALKTGEVVEELLIPKGTRIYASIAAYNRTPEIFGSDAHSFNPDRWLKAEEEKTGTSIGVYANLFTFSGGVRSCIGWRFAVLELQAFIVSIFGKFELSLAVDPEKVRREACSVMLPTIEGEEEKGCQLPVRVKLASS